MKLSGMLDKITGKPRYVTADDIRNVFGDYHNALHWFAAFLIRDENLADTCVVDACRIAEIKTAAFHEWLVHWAVRATVRYAFHGQRRRIAELAPLYEQGEPVQEQLLPPLTAESFRLLVNDAEAIHARLDVVCRFVLVLRGIAKDSPAEVATQLGISRSAIERAYRHACDALGVSSNGVGARADVGASRHNHERTLAGSVA